MANAPDGCLWVIDICRELIETTESLPPSIIRQMDVTSGVDRGRIWRIAPEGYRPRMPKLGKATSDELVALLEHPDGWHRDTASRLLYQRQDRSAVPGLRRLAAGSKRPIGRAQALSSLAGLGALESGDVLAALNDPDPHLRAHALRLAEPFGESDGRIAARMTEMTNDPDAMVRYQLAFSLGVMPGGRPARRSRTSPFTMGPIPGCGWRSSARCCTARARSSRDWPPTAASAARRTAAAC